MSLSAIDSNTFGAQSAAGTTQLSAKAQAASASTTDSSSGNVNNLSSTFLQLLTQELQNQDPTAPMDSTQMVAQMISLNQLEQLASINQTLTKSANASASGVASVVSPAGSTPAAAQAASAGTARAAVQAASVGNTLGNTSSLLQNAGLSTN